MTIKAALKAYIKADLANDKAEEAAEGTYGWERKAAQKIIVRTEKQLEKAVNALYEIEIDEDTFDDAAIAVAPEGYALELLDHGNWN